MALFHSWNREKTKKGKSSSAHEHFKYFFALLALLSAHAHACYRLCHIYIFKNLHWLLFLNSPPPNHICKFLVSCCGVVVFSCHSQLTQLTPDWLCLLCCLSSFNVCIPKKVVSTSLAAPPLRWLHHVSLPKNLVNKATRKKKPHKVFSTFHHLTPNPCPNLPLSTFLFASNKIRGVVDITVLPPPLPLPH